MKLASLNKEFFVNVQKKTGAGTLGVLIVLLYPFFIYAVIGTLGTYHFQDKLQSIVQTKGLSVDEEQITVPSILIQIDQLERIDEEKELLEERRKSLSSKLDRLDQKLNNSSQHYKKITIKIDQKQMELNQLVAVREARLKIVQKEPSPKKMIDHLTVESPEIQQAWKEKQKLQKMREEVQIEKNNLKLKHEETTGQLFETKESIFAFEDATISFLEEKEIRNIATELQFITRFFPLLPLIPKYILTLILTLAMGALGSLLYITHDYFKRDSDHPISWYLLRPFLGTTTALAMFILAKAGQMTISGGTAEESLIENLNPFFISFLAIISGLLSEQAIEKIKSAAEPIFRTEEKGGVPKMGSWYSTSDGTTEQKG